MKKIILVLTSFMILITSYSQSTFNSEEYKFKIDYPADWDVIESKDDVVFTLVYQLDPSGKPRIATGFVIVAKASTFEGDLEKMAISYRKELYSRTEFEKEEILSEEVIDFHGVKAINIYGVAKIPILKQKLKWRILLFEYQGNYYEISFTSTKKDFDKNDAQSGFKILSDSYEFTE